MDAYRPSYPRSDDPTQHDQLKLRGIAPQPWEAPEQPAAVPADRLADRLDAEGGWWDIFSSIIFPVFASLGASAGAALISPEVAAAGNWVAVFIATFTWSLGCALATFFVKSNKLQGPEAGRLSRVLWKLRWRSPT